MTTKPPTTRGVSRLLTDAEFEKSVSTPSRIRGWKNHSPGFVVLPGVRDGVVLVRHRTFSARPFGRDLETIAVCLKEYAEIIALRGYRVAQDDQAPYGGLIVTAREDRP